MPSSQPFEEISSDCYITPPNIVELAEGVWPQGPDLDPFWDPQTLVKSSRGLDVRAGDDAYDYAWGPGRWWVNGPYSGQHPRRTAECIARQLDAARGSWRAPECMNLCLCAPGSTYWSEYVWPWAQAIAWCGRLSFVAGRDMFNKDGVLTARKGELCKGNRSEIALVYSGPHGGRFTAVAGRQFPVSPGTPY